MTATAAPALLSIQDHDRRGSAFLPRLAAAHFVLFFTNSGRQRACPLETLIHASNDQPSGPSYVAKEVPPTVCCLPSRPCSPLSRRHTRLPSVRRPPFLWTGRRPGTNSYVLFRPAAKTSAYRLCYFSQFLAFVKGGQESCREFCGKSGKEGLILPTTVGIIPTAVGIRGHRSLA